MGIQGRTSVVKVAVVAARRVAMVVVIVDVGARRVAQTVTQWH